MAGLFTESKHPRGRDGKFVDVIGRMGAMGGKWDADKKEWVVPVTSASELAGLLHDLDLDHHSTRLDPERDEFSASVAGPSVPDIGDRLRASPEFQARQEANAVHDAFKNLPRDDPSRPSLKDVTGTRASAAIPFQQRFVEEMRTERPRFGEGRVDLTDDSDPDMAEAVQEVARFFPAEWIENAGPVRVEARPGQGPFHISGEHARGGVPVIVVGRPDQTKLLAHEMAHWLEATNPQVGREARAFLERRTEGRPIEPMPSGGPNERMRDGGFPDPYVGKVYEKTGATEVLSMAMEGIVGGAVRIENDDDWWRWTLDLLAHG